MTTQSNGYLENGITNTIGEQAKLYSGVSKKKAPWNDEIFQATEESIFSGETQFSKAHQKLSNSLMKKVTKGSILTNPRDGVQSYVWKRLSEVFDIKVLNVAKEPNEIKSNPTIMAEDVVQGELGDCYFLSALASLAENPTRLKRYFKNTNLNDAGCFQVQVYIHGLPVSIILDDNFVFKQNVYQDESGEEKTDLSLAFTKINPTTNNIWPILLEKAWAKLNKNYENIIQGNCSEAFEFLSPAPFTTLFHSVHKTCVFEKIQSALEKNYLVCCDITGNSLSKELNKLANIGLVSNHAYTILEVAEISDLKGDKTQLLRVRNPWGRNEWQGDWSDKSTKWTEELKTMLNYTDAEDGIFWIALNDYLKFYTSTHILHERDGFNYECGKYSFNKGQEFNLFKINIPKNTSGAFIVNQKNVRIYRALLGNEQFENHYGSVILYKYEDGELVALGSDSGKKSRFSIELEDIPKGDYYIALNFPFHYQEIVKTGDFEKNAHIEVEQFSIGIGVYTSALGVTIEDIPETNEDFVQIFLDYVRSSSQNLEDKYFFEEEGEKNSYRAAFFDQNTAYGYIFYENKSEGFINELLSFQELENINIYPILRKGELKELTEMIEKTEDPEELKYLKKLESKVDVESKIDILTSKTKNFRISKKTPFEVKIRVAPNTCGVILLEKVDEEAKVDFESKLVISYPIHTILNSNKFSSSSTKVKYNNKLVDIYETIIEHPNGVLIRYRNKSKNLVFGSLLKFKELKNLKIALNSDELKIHELEVEAKEEILEDTDNVRLATDENINNLDEFNLEVKDPKNEAALVVEPGQVKFINLETSDLFGTFSYSLDSTFFINLSKYATNK